MDGRSLSKVATGGQIALAVPTSFLVGRPFLESLTDLTKTCIDLKQSQFRHFFGSGVKVTISIFAHVTHCMSQSCSPVNTVHHHNHVGH